MEFNKIEVRAFRNKLPDNIKFDSWNSNLNEFLYEESIDYCKSNLAVIYLIFYEDHLIAYF